MLYLQHETIDQTEVSTGDAHDRGDRLFVGKIIGMGLDPMTPALAQEIVRLPPRDNGSISCAKPTWLSRVVEHASGVFLSPAHPK
jgi:hypothetical protein